eukprot:3474223-Pleurochrysis_carterae.AAC.3
MDYPLPLPPPQAWRQRLRRPLPSSPRCESRLRKQARALVCNIVPPCRSCAKKGSRRIAAPPDICGGIHQSCDSEHISHLQACGMIEWVAVCTALRKASHCICRRALCRCCNTD